MSTEWLHLSTEGRIFWTTEETKVHYEGHDLILIPESDMQSTGVIFEFATTEFTRDEAVEFVFRYLSALSWMTNAGVRASNWYFSGRRMAIPKRIEMRATSVKFDEPFLPESLNEKQARALALYRDALSVNNVPYKFLGLFRILNIMGAGGVQKNWINQNLGKIRFEQAIEAREKMKEQGINNFGEHLYKNGRSAVAHAQSELVNPDLVNDLERMKLEMPLLCELVEIFIEQELGVKSRLTVFNEHLFELKGFREILSEGLINEVESGRKRSLNVGEIQTRFDIGIRLRAPYLGMQNLRVIEGEIANGRLELLLQNEDDSIQNWLALDFAKEHLRFSVESGFRHLDKGTKKSAEMIKSQQEFFRDLFLNGSVQVLESHTGKLLGFTHDYIPTNIDPVATSKSFSASIAYWESEMNRREL